MEPTSNYRAYIRQCYCFIKKEINFNLVKWPLMLICSLCFIILLSFCSSWAPGSFKITSRHEGYDQKDSFFQPSPANDDKKCDLFKGRWISDTKGPLYTNFSCKTIPDKKNCFLHGRMDKGFLQWRWKPDECELPVFNPRSFLSIVRGKTLAFIGDSISRNQMESLLCLLSKEETPEDVYKDAKDRFRTWLFAHHNFTLVSLWSRFLVTSSQTVVNGSVTGAFDVHLDKVDDNWAQKLPAVDYAIFSDAQWFLRQNYLYEGGNLIGCIYCQEPNVTDLGPEFAIQRAYRTAFKYINDCKNSSEFVTLLRTISPSQFENGTWKTGGSCKRTSPLNPEEINNSGATDLDYRNIQVAEIENARKLGEKNGNAFDVLDVTGAMLMRPDGHPGLHWRNKKKGYSDCVHWCLPGPIDVWNEFLLEVLRRQSRFPLRT